MISEPSATSLISWYLWMPGSSVLILMKLTGFSWELSCWKLFWNYTHLDLESSLECFGMCKLMIELIMFKICYLQVQTIYLRNELDYYRAVGHFMFCKLQSGLWKIYIYIQTTKQFTKRPKLFQATLVYSNEFGRFMVS